MNRLKFKGSDQFYTGEVTPIGRNKVSIEFVGGIPKGIDTSLIEAFTPGGVKFLELTGFTTEYRRVDASLVLSNDGSVFIGEIIQEIDQEKALDDYASVLVHTPSGSSANKRRDWHWYLQERNPLQGGRALERQYRNTM